MDNILYRFNIAGSEYNIIGTKETGFRFKNHYSSQSIILSTNLNNVPYHSDILLRNAWIAIIHLIVEDVMKHTDGIWKENVGRFATVLSIIPNDCKRILKMLEHRPEITPTLGIGGQSYTVKFDNEYLESIECYGECDPNHNIIRLSTYTESKTELAPYTFIHKVLLHEAIHGVNSVLLLVGTKFDKESFVNTLAHFLFEVNETLKPKSWLQEQEDLAIKGLGLMNHSPLEIDTTKLTT